MNHTTQSTHTGRCAHTSVGSHVAYARVHTQTLCPLRDTSCELFCQIQFYQSVGHNDPSWLYALEFCYFMTDGVPELTQNNAHRLHFTRIRRRRPARRTARAQEQFCPSHDRNSLEQQHLRSRFFSHVGESDRATRVGRGHGRLGLGRARSFDASLRQSSNWC